LAKGAGVALKGIAAIDNLLVVSLYRYYDCGVCCFFLYS
jgi:hypothetical protein